MNIPVYMIAGFLDSGKTNFINGILADGFAIEDRTLLLCCEEGEECCCEEEAVAEEAAPAEEAATEADFEA